MSRKTNGELETIFVLLYILFFAKSDGYRVQFIPSGFVSGSVWRFAYSDVAKLFACVAQSCNSNNSNLNRINANWFGLPFITTNGFSRRIEIGRAHV